MKAIKAVTLLLGELDKIVISEYQLGLIVNRIYKKKSYKGEHINLQKDFAEKKDVTKYLKLLLGEGILTPYKNIKGVFTLIGKVNQNTEDIACTVDPFCYISHLSAMSYHGLTDRIPNKLYLSSPLYSEWRLFAEEQMRKDLGEDLIQYKKNGLPKLVRLKMEKINKTEVQHLNSKHLGAYKSVRGRAIRVSTIGRTFLEMLKKPELCGGINHVLDIFEEYGEKYLRLITDDIDKNGTPIVKVRAGYILEERLNIKNDIIDKWSSFAQRGGSRKLDPKAEYIPEWSDKWKISLNVFRSNK